MTVGSHVIEIPSGVDLHVVPHAPPSRLLRLLTDLTFPLMCEAAVAVYNRASCLDRHTRSVFISTLLIALQRFGIEAVRMPSQLLPFGHVRIVVANRTLNPIVLKKGTPVAMFEHHFADHYE
ncbi:MAG: hypothetical protein BJ554DRAFT_4968, partial [Olpidium bornovanus]